MVHINAHPHALSRCDLSVLMLDPMADGASCILNCGYLRSHMGGSSVGGFQCNVHHFTSDSSFT